MNTPSTHTIVCIDDEEHNNQALERLLRKHYNVMTFTQPEDALKAIEQLQPSLIISDQRMPNMTGVELLKKSMELSTESLRILLTGYTDLESVIAAINDGQIYRYITKPWDPQDLLLNIQKAIETYELKNQVKKQNLALQSLDQLKTNFMLMVSHELRTPLAGIVSFVDLLKETVKNEDEKTYIKFIDNNTQRLRQLIDDILVITKLQTSTIGAPAEDIDLKTEIQALWDELTDKKTNHELELSLETTSCHCNKKMFLDILNRLLKNSLQFSKSKSKIRVESHLINSKTQLLISNKVEKDLAVDPKELGQAFIKDENIMNHTKGAGLGLTVVRALVEAIGGTITISYFEKTFKVELIL